MASLNLSEARSLELALEALVVKASECSLTSQSNSPQPFNCGSDSVMLSSL